MPTTVTLDTVADSSADVDILSATGSLVRGGLVTGLSGDPSTALAQVFAAVNATVTPGTAYPGTAAAVYTRLRVQPVNGDMAAVQLFYTKPSGFPLTAFTISTRSYLASFQTKNIIATSQPIPLQLIQGGQPIRTQSVIDSTTIAMREITVQGISIGVASDATFEKYEGKTNYVNLEPWRNRAKGYWLCSDGGVDSSPLTGTYGWHLSAITRNICDWSEVRNFTDRQTGSEILPNDADLAALTGATYSQGIIKVVNAGTRWAQFPTTSFTTLFGFNGLGGQPPGQQVGWGGSGGSPTNL